MSSSSGSAIPYIGSKISLVTNSELRYEGILVNINTANSTVTLKDVRMSGTENRKAPHFVMPSAEVFDYIIFNGKDIKDLTVSEPAFSIKEDPAVVAVNVAPPNTSFEEHYNMGIYDNHNIASTGLYPSMQQRRMNASHIMQRDSGNVFPPPPPPRGFSPNQPRFGRARDFYGMMYSGRNVRNSSRLAGSGGLGGKNIVGELSAQPNSSLKTQVAPEFDFEQSNSKFEKEKLAEESKPLPPPYDKNASFFDNISCETLNRQQGRDSKLDREKQRELDTETFGPAAALVRGPRYRRTYRKTGLRGGRGNGGNMFGSAMYNTRPMMNNFYRQDAFGMNQMLPVI